jgi:hypothetical protein
MRITTNFKDDDAKSKKRKSATFLVNLSSNNHIMCFFLSCSAAFLSSLNPLSLSLSLSLSHICMSMSQSNPSLSVVSHKISQFFYCKMHLAHCIFVQNQAGYLTGPPFLALPSFLRTPQDIRCSKNQPVVPELAFMKKLKYSFKCSIIPI